MSIVPNFIDREDLLLKLSSLEEKDYDKTIFSNITAWGQLKLLFADIEFLTTFYDPIKYDKQIYVLYLNPDAGNYLSILSELFPDLIFLLHNSNLFNKKNVGLIGKLSTAIKSGKIVAYHDFVEADIEKYMGRNDIFLISNIYSQINEINSDADKLSLQRVEANMKDMDFQRRIYTLIKPLQASLRFRLPTNFEDAPTSFQYLYGYLFKMPFVSLRSTETRLVPVEGQIKNWNMKSYYRKVLSFNALTRNVEKFINPFSNGYTNITDNDELINDWDTMAYLQVISTYLVRFNNELVTKENIIKLHNYFMTSLQLRAGETYSISGRRATERARMQLKK